MLLKKSSDISFSEVTPESIYLNRRAFMSRAVTVGAGLFAGQRTFQRLSTPETALASSGLPYARSQFSVMDPRTKLEYITHYNNFYEFGAEKDEPAKYANTLRTRPWTIAVEGRVKKSKTLDLDTIMKLAPVEERVYRHRCVEGWSMVIPWLGFSLSHLINVAEPLPSAKYVQFFTLFDDHQMPHAGNLLEWPYREALRMDEAMHPLALLVVGLYGEMLPNQNGAPARIHIPWKYGFKSCKSIVKLKFTDKQPETTWNALTPSEYGFYANVNPAVDHPRWSQASERVIGGSIFASRKQTQIFNGYADQVSSLYGGLDLKKNF